LSSTTFLTKEFQLCSCGYFTNLSFNSLPVKRTIMKGYFLFLFALIVVASAYKMSQSEAAAALSGAGISVSSSGGCSTRSNSRCTSLDQINSNTINGLITLKRASGCSIVVTGGSEVGHASGTYSHYTGYKADISLNSCIDSYITKNFASIGTRSDGAAQYKSASGNIYAKEGNHWDILYY